MAKAPRVGSTPTAQAQKSEEEDGSRTGLIISCGDKEYRLNAVDIGPRDDLMCRRETGFPVSPFFDSERFGTDSLLILYWVARVKSGDKNLRFEEVLTKFPNMKAIEEADFKIVSEEDDAADEDPLESEDS